MSNIRLWNILARATTPAAATNRIGAVIFDEQSGGGSGIFNFLTVTITNIFVTRDLSMFDLSGIPTISQLQNLDPLSSSSSSRFLVSLGVLGFSVSGIWMQGTRQGINDWTRMTDYNPDQNESFILTSIF